MKIKKGDKVQIIAGKDKGKEGVVLAAYPRLDKVLVEGINRVTKHEKIRTNQRGSKSGGIVTKEAADSRLQRDVPRGWQAGPGGLQDRRGRHARSVSRARPARRSADVHSDRS